MKLLGPSRLREKSNRPPLGVRVVDRIAKLLTLYGTSSPIRDIDGCCLQNSKGQWQVWFGIDLLRAYDLLSGDDKMSGFNRHIKLIGPLVGKKVHLEVLSVPVGYEERYARFRLYEIDDENPVGQDPEWEKARHARVHELTTWLQNAGDVESRAYLGVNISPASDDVLSAEAFGQLSLEDRFGIRHFQNSHLLPEVERLHISLKAAWGGKIDPLDRDELDVLLALTNWPGQPQIFAPDPAIGAIGGRKTEISHYGSCNYQEAAPGVLEFDYLGAKSYASFVPMVIAPAREFLPDADEEFAFCTDSAGRRVRISWRFKVWNGPELLMFARRTLRRNENQQIYLAENEGQIADLDRSVATAHHFYKYLLDDGVAIVGPPVMVVTGDSVKSVQQEVLKQASTLHKKVHLVTDAVVYQAPLYEHSRPGSSDYLKRFEQYLTPEAFARGMALVTSAPRTNGPDLLGWVRGREGVPFTGGYDLATLLPSLDLSPTNLWCGPSGGGKTTSITDQMVALIERAAYVGFIFELEKEDTRRLLGDDQLGISVRPYKLEDYPGLLNPAGFAMHPSQRVDFMTDFLKSCVGSVSWSDDFVDPLRDACKTAISEADKAGKMRPNLYRVVELLQGVKLIGAILEKTIGDEKVARVFFSDNYDASLIDEMILPGLNVIGQEHFSIPDGDDRTKYTSQNWLALAGLDIVTMLAQKVANDRNVRVAMATVEFWRTAQLSEGATEAAYRARVDRGKRCASGYDTQYPEDVAYSLMKQVTTGNAFSVLKAVEVEQSLTMLGLEITPQAINSFMNMAADIEGGTDANKGTYIVVLPTLERLRVQSLRMYLPPGRTTKSELPEELRSQSPKEG